MELIYNFIKSRQAQLTRILLEAGIPSDKTDAFLEYASYEIANVLGVIGIEKLLVTFVSGDVHGFLSEVDLNSMSSQLQMKEEQVFAGMYAIWPVISGLVDNEDISAHEAASTIYSNLTSS